MASVTTTELDERIREQFAAITEPASPSVDEATDEAVLSYSVEYEYLQQSAEEFQEEVNSFARSLGGTVSVSGIGHETVTIEFRFESWSDSE